MAELPCETSRHCCSARVRFWHKADNPAAPAFVRYWGTSGHRLVRGAASWPDQSSSEKINVILHSENCYAGVCWGFKICLDARAEENHFNANADHKDDRDRDDMMRAHRCLLSPLLKIL